MTAHRLLSSFDAWCVTDLGPRIVYCWTVGMCRSILELKYALILLQTVL
jgi:hypothetical protein